jgi:hypothetical protein
VRRKAVDIQAVDDAGAMILPQRRRDSRPVPDKPLWITITKNVARSGPQVSSCVGDGCNVKNGFCHRGVNVALLLLFSAWREAILFGSESYYNPLQSETSCMQEISVHAPRSTSACDMLFSGNPGFL